MEIIHFTSPSRSAKWSESHFPLNSIQFTNNMCVIWNAKCISISHSLIVRFKKQFIRWCSSLYLSSSMDYWTPTVTLMSSAIIVFLNYSTILHFPALILMFFWLFQALILVPFRAGAMRVVQTLIGLLESKGKKIVVSNKKRFKDEFGEEEDENPSNLQRPDDYRTIFSGNVDDHFRIGTV